MCVLTQTELPEMLFLSSHDVWHCVCLRRTIIHYAAGVSVIKLVYECYGEITCKVLWVDCELLLNLSGFLMRGTECWVVALAKAYRFTGRYVPCPIRATEAGVLPSACLLFHSRRCKRAEPGAGWGAQCPLTFIYSAPMRWLTAACFVLAYCFNEP